MASDVGVTTMAVTDNEDYRARVFRLPGNRVILARFVVPYVAGTEDTGSEYYILSAPHT